jgi:phosphoenolpyruvate synthase/pyruvate phosphate dikinase
MPILWLKFPDEALFYRQFDADEKKKLEDIFSTAGANSAWRKALVLLGVAPRQEKLICWHKDVPYFNWCAMVRIISGGAATLIPTETGAYRFQLDYTLPRLWRMLAFQWKVARFMQKSAGTDKLAESLALGLALQSLILQLGSDASHMATWLAQPDKAPAKYRRVLRRLQEVQMLRTGLTPAWKEIFPDKPETAAEVQNLPDHFWDTPSENTQEKQSLSQTGAWKGLPVCPGLVTGIAVTDMKNIPVTNNPLILVFRRARPETTELFHHAAALVFAEGGVLSHACTVARERNIPAVTGLGADFIDQLQSQEKIWLTVDGADGSVKITET